MGEWCPPVTLDITSSSGFGYEICALESTFLSGSSNSEGKAWLRVSRRIQVTPKRYPNTEISGIYG